MSKKIAILISTTLILAFASINAQTDSLNNSSPVTRKGKAIGPRQGDYAIGIDATPFLEYLGNVLNISDQLNEAPTFGFTAQNPGMIYFKYMKSDFTAYRVAFRIGFSSNTDKDGNGVNDSEIDKYKYTATNLGITLGIEKSPFMKSRLRGFYGASVSLGSAPYLGTSYSTGQIVMGKYRFIDATNDRNNYVEKGGTTLEAGIGGLVGLEFFIAPKISLTGQFNLMLAYSYQTERKYVPETGSEVIMDAGSSSFILDNMASGALVLMCYF
jgi:hypothetical protein